MLKNGLMKHGIHHIGFVARNLDEAVELWNVKYGIEGYQRYHFVPQKAWLRGQPVEGFSLNIAMLETTGYCTIEIVEPDGGNSIFHEFLTDHEEGFHHLCFSVKQFDVWKKSLLENGNELLFECETEDEIIGFRRGMFCKDMNLNLILELKEIPYFRK